MGEVMDLIKENPLSILSIFTILIVITGITVYLWNQKSDEEKMTLNSNIHDSVDRIKEMAEILPTPVQKPLSGVLDGIDGAVGDKLKPYTPLYTRSQPHQNPSQSSEQSQPSSHASKSEKKCKEIVERIFQKEFVTVRPDWLKNPLSGRNLELDLYNEELKLGVEYDGIQHKEYNSKWHGNKEEFDDQVLRDKMKNKLCKKNGVTLIRVPHDCGDMEKYIKRECIVHGLIDP
jgi:hypothetical protein